VVADAGLFVARLDQNRGFLNFRDRVVEGELEVEPVGMAALGEQLLGFSMSVL
jgi:hypothetical protein